MRQLGHEVSALGVAKMVRDFAGALMIDSAEPQQRKVKHWDEVACAPQRCAHPRIKGDWRRTGRAATTRQSSGNIFICQCSFPSKTSPARRRLAPIAHKRRTALAVAMEDVFAAVAAVRGIDAVFVVSNHGATELREVWEWEVIRERQVSESDSVDRASQTRCAGSGSHCCGCRSIFHCCCLAMWKVLACSGPAPACVLVASRDGAWEPMLMRTPPGLFRFTLGAGQSAQTHC